MNNMCISKMLVFALLVNIVVYSKADGGSGSGANINDTQGKLTFLVTKLLSGIETVQNKTVSVTSSVAETIKLHWLLKKIFSEKWLEAKANIFKYESAYTNKELISCTAIVIPTIYALVKLYKALTAQEDDDDFEYDDEEATVKLFGKK